MNTIFLFITLYLANAMSATQTSSKTKLPELPRNVTINKNYTESPANESFICPNLTKPDCQVKELTNLMLGKCIVCVISENFSCDPLLDACENGTACLPRNLKNSSLNACSKLFQKVHFEKTMKSQQISQQLCRKGECVTLGKVPNKIDGGWSRFDNWSSCSKTCGRGVRWRIRRCDSPKSRFGGFLCKGENKEYEICNAEV